MGVRGKIKRAIIVVILAVLAIVTIFPIWFLLLRFLLRLQAEKPL